MLATMFVPVTACASTSHQQLQDATPDPAPVAALRTCSSACVSGDDDWLSAASDPAEDLAQLGCQAHDPRALVNSQSPWLCSNELWALMGAMALGEVFVQRQHTPVPPGAEDPFTQ
jgi:hypothetical protein